MARMLKLIPLVVFTLVLACSGGSENRDDNSSNGGNNSGTSDISGVWYVSVKSNTNGNITPYVANINQTDTAFTGTIKFGLIFSRDFNGSIQSTELSFVSSGDTLHFRGRVVVGDSISGTWKNIFTQDSGTWYAIRPAATYDWNGNYDGKIYIINIPNIDTLNVTDGVWKMRTLKGSHADTVFVSGELLSYYGSDTIGLNVPAGGWIYNDSLFLDAPCIVSGAQGEMMFSGAVSGDSVFGSWGIRALSGTSPNGQGSFNGFVGN